MATLAPARQKMRAISLPMPLAAPVTTATLLLKFMESFFHLFYATDLGDMSEAGGALADVFVGQTVS
jgi:hypothetical protein